MGSGIDRSRQRATEQSFRSLGESNVKVKSFTQWTFVLTVLLLSLAGCGKSAKEIAAKAEQERVAAEAAAKAASAALVAQARTAKQAELLEKARAALKDPSSAQFQGVRVNNGGTAICGKMNAKNSFGGYVGFRDFVGTDEGVVVKPPECGEVGISTLAERSSDSALACMQYVRMTVVDKVCD